MNRELMERVPEVLRRGQHDEMIDLAARIDAALAAPEPDAMELATAIIEAQHASNTYNDWVLNAAALIESHSKRVPRAMLEEVYRLGYSSAVEEGKWKISYDTIAEKFHVAIEDVE